jgi:cell wall-associated NlpC family hydrolase
MLADMHVAPREDAGLDTQLLFGEEVAVFERMGGWAWIQSAGDGYVGYVREADLGFSGAEPTHVVAAPRTFLYREPDLKLPRTGCFSMGSRLRVAGIEERRGTHYAVLTSGEAVIAGHVRPLDQHAADHASVAATLLYVPYLWGGATAFGIDCSGLVQLSMRMAGKNVLRDTDMQAETIGQPVEPGDGFAGLRRGDLVFWKGHVGIVTNATTLIHANGHTMMVSCEPLRQAVERIGYLYGGPTGFRRP